MKKTPVNAGKARDKKQHRRSPMINVLGTYWFASSATFLLEEASVGEIDHSKRYPDDQIDEDNVVDAVDVPEAPPPIVNSTFIRTIKVVLPDSIIDVIVTKVEGILVL